MEWIYEKERIYSKNEEGKVIAEAILKEKSNGEMDIEHVFVDSSLRGQGIASKIMEVVSEHLRKEGIKTTATCSYANTWLHKNIEEYKDIVSEELNDIMACSINGKH